MAKGKKKIDNRMLQPNPDLVLKKHVGLIHCENRLSLIQRKICNILLFNALDKINDEPIHHIALKQLCSLVGYHSNDTSQIKKALKHLISVVMEWNLLDDNKFLQAEGVPEDAIAWNASALLAGATIYRGLVSYSYSPQIRSVLASLEIYGRINLFVQSKFDSSYSLVLYENCVRFKNVKQTAWFSLNLFRSLMGVSKEKYPSFKEFKRNVISVAVREINQKSDIFIEPQFRRSGRHIVALQFSITENERYQPAFRKTIKKLQIDRAEPAQDAIIVETLRTQFHLSEQQVEDLQTQYTADYLLAKINLVKAKANIKNRGAFLIAAIRDDYQEVPGKAMPPAPVIQHSAIRQPQEAVRVNSLDRQYKIYKFNAYHELFLRQLPAQQNEIIQSLQNYLKANHFVFELYKKHGFKSPFAMAEFINFIEHHYPKLVPSYLSFEEYITAEADSVT